MTESLKSYTVTGRHKERDKYPSLFLEPPEGFDAGPAPCDFKDGDRVLVRDTPGGNWERAYFYKYASESAFPFRCYTRGDNWTSEGEDHGWRYCKKWGE
jgi:hypothetical protein